MSPRSSTIAAGIFSQTREGFMSGPEDQLAA
jgi:hypothetical protein